MFAGNLAAEAIDIVVIAFDFDHVRLVDQIPKDLSGLQIAGNEHVGTHSSGSSMGGNRIGQVTGRGTGNGLESQFAGSSDGDSHNPIFERERGMIDRIVLNVKLIQPEVGAEVFGAHQRRHPRMWTEKVRPFHRKEIGIAPDTVWAFLDLLAGNDSLDLFVVVLYLEGAKAHLTDMDRLRRIFFATLATD